MCEFGIFTAIGITATITLVAYILIVGVAYAVEVIKLVRDYEYRRDNTILQVGGSNITRVDHALGCLSNRIEELELINQRKSKK